MLNARENILRVFRNEPPERFPRDADSHVMLFPGDRAGPWNKGEDKGYDWFGVHWTVCPGVGQTITPNMPPIVTDFENWREQIKFPDPHDHDWEAEAARQTAVWDRDNQIGALTIVEGPFERLHSLLGFENALMAFYDYPDELTEYFDAITEYKLECLRIGKQYFQPDLIIMHDDWGTNRSMFFNPELWRTYLKPCFARLIQETHRLGMYYEHHSCGHIEPILGDMIELGMDSIQPLQHPQNNIKAMMEQYGGQFVSHGGYDGTLVLSADSTAEEMRESIRYSLETLSPGGRHMPYIPFVGPDTEWRIALMEEEISRFEREHRGKTQ